MSYDNVNKTEISSSFFPSGAVSNDDAFICWRTCAVRAVAVPGSFPKGAAGTDGHKYPVHMQTQIYRAPSWTDGDLLGGPPSHPAQPPPSRTSRRAHREWTPRGVPQGACPPRAVACAHGTSYPGGRAALGQASQEHGKNRFSSPFTGRNSRQVTISFSVQKAFKGTPGSQTRFLALGVMHFARYPRPQLTATKGIIMSQHPAFLEPKMATPWPAVLTMPPLGIEGIYSARSDSGWIL